MAAICLALAMLVAAANLAAQTPAPSPDITPKAPPRIVVVREHRPMVLEALIKRELPGKPKRPLVSDRVP